MYCANCGAKVEDNQRFCSVCGAKIDQNADTVVVEDVKSATDNALEISEHESNLVDADSSGQEKTDWEFILRNIIAPIGIVVLVGFKLVGFFFSFELTTNEKLPFRISELNNGEVVESLRVEEVSCDSGFFHTDIKITGRKCFDAEGNYNSSICRFKYKLLSEDGTEIESGSLQTDAVKVSDKFEVTKRVDVAKGTFIIELSDYEEASALPNQSDQNGEVYVENQGKEYARSAYWSGYTHPFYALPIKCDGNNIVYSSEILEVRNLKFIESIEKPDATWLDYTVEIEIKDDYHYDGISLWFGVSDKHGNLYAYNDDPAIGMVVIDNVQQGDGREAKMSAFLKPGEFENGNAIEIVFLGCEVY